MLVEKDLFVEFAVDGLNIETTMGGTVTAARPITPGFLMTGKQEETSAPERNMIKEEDI